MLINSVVIRRKEKKWGEGEYRDGDAFVDFRPGSSVPFVVSILFPGCVFGDYSKGVGWD